MNVTFQAYDLTLAVIARRTLLLEARTNEERAQLVWQPMQEWLESLASASPSELICFAGDAYQFPKESTGRCVNIYAVNHAKQVAYLGTIFTPQAEHDDRTREVARLNKLDRHQAEYLATRSRTVIIRNRCFCKIPVTEENLDEAVLDQAVRRYMRTFSPPLSNLPIRHLPHEEGAELDKKIWQKAEATARRSPEDEHFHKTAEDEVWE